MREMLEQREKRLRDQIDADERRLADIGAAIERDGVVVTGSRGQNRPNGLLAAEREVRREMTRAFDELADVLSRLEAEAMLERANAITSWAKPPTATR